MRNSINKPKNAKYFLAPALALGGIASLIFLFGGSVQAITLIPAADSPDPYTIETFVPDQHNSIVQPDSNIESPSDSTTTNSSSYNPVSPKPKPPTPPVKPPTPPETPPDDGGDLDDDVSFERPDNEEVPPVDDPVNDEVPDVGPSNEGGDDDENPVKVPTPEVPVGNYLLTDLLITNGANQCVRTQTREALDIDTTSQNLHITAKSYLERDLETRIELIGNAADGTAKTVVINEDSYQELATIAKPCLNQNLEDFQSFKVRFEIYQSKFGFAASEESNLDAQKSVFRQCFTSFARTIQPAQGVTESGLIFETFINKFATNNYLLEKNSIVTLDENLQQAFSQSIKVCVAQSA